VATTTVLLPATDTVFLTSFGLVLGFEVPSDSPASVTLTGAGRLSANLTIIHSKAPIATTQIGSGYSPLNAFIRRTTVRKHR
jgi:hypothetical protein